VNKSDLTTALTAFAIEGPTMESNVTTTNNVTNQDRSAGLEAVSVT